MSLNLIRMRFAAVAAKVEVTAGVDAIAGSPAAADWVAGDCQVTFNPNVTENPELTGSLDKSPGIFGGLKPNIRLRMPLRGSGTPGTVPEFGKLLRACTYAETITATALGAPTALPASGHTTTSVTLATTPYVATAQAYRGMPLILSGAVADMMFDEVWEGPPETVVPVSVVAELLSMTAAWFSAQFSCADSDVIAPFVTVCAVVALMVLALEPN